MRLSAILLATLVALSSAVARPALAQTITVYDTNRLLKFRGSLRVGCYVLGTELLVGRVIRSTNPYTGQPIDLFEVQSRAWIKRERSNSPEARRLRQIKSQLAGRVSRSRRAELRRELKVATRAYQKVNNQANAVLGAPCENHRRRIVGNSAPTPTPSPTPTPDENPGTELLSLTENLFAEKLLDSHQLALIPPSQTTTILFVDSIDGADSSNGFTDEDAFRTVGRALSYLSTIASNGRVDAQVYLRRGGSYAISNLALSGQSLEAPLVFGAYGDLPSERPRMAPITITVPVKNLAFSDMLFDAPSPGSGTAFNVTSPIENLLIQNSVIRGFQNGIVVQANAQAKEISVYRNIITDLWSTAGPSFGVKLNNIYRAIVSSNVFDRIGQRTASGFVPNEQSTAISISATEEGGIARANQIFRSSRGIDIGSSSTSAMAHVHANAIVRTGIAGTLDARGIYLGENIVLEGTDIGSLNRGWGFDVRNASAVQAYRNVIANSESSTEDADYALKFSGAAHFGFYDIAGLDVHNAADIHMGGFTWDSNKVPFSLALKDSSVQNTRDDGADNPLLTIQGLPASVLKTDFRRLRLFNSADSTQRLYRIIEDGSISQVRELGYWSGSLWWRRWHCTGIELRVSPNLRMQSDNWYNGFEIRQNSMNRAADNHDNPNRFTFNECFGGYQNGPYTAEQRVTKPKWEQYADDQNSTIAQTTYVAPNRTPGAMLGVNNVPGSTLDDYVDYMSIMDRGAVDFRFVGQRLSQWLRAGFNRP